MPLFDFTGQVAVNGYEVVEASAKRFVYKRPPVLIAKPPATFRDISFELPPKFFWELVLLESDLTNHPEQVVQFANRYGWLGLPRQEYFVRGQRVGVPGEAIAAWEDQVKQMQFVFAMQMRPRELLEKHIRWSKDKVVCQTPFPGPDRTHVIASSSVRPELLASLTPGDLERPAVVFVQQALDQRLQKLQVTPTAPWDAEEGRATLRFRPSRLIDALWFSLSEAIASGLEFRKCQECGKWFELTGHAGKRADRQFCSDSCRVTAHRKKQDRARAMYYVEKQSFEKIAEALGTTPESVKKWITGVKE